MFCRKTTRRATVEVLTAQIKKQRGLAEVSGNRYLRSRFVRKYQKALILS